MVELYLKMFRVLFWTFVHSLMLLAPIFAAIVLSVGKFYDVLAAMLDFRFFENFEIQNIYPK